MLFSARPQARISKIEKSPNSPKNREIDNTGNYQYFEKDPGQLSKILRNWSKS